MADMIVAGAGTTAVNGTYVENGTLNGKPYYISGTTHEGEATLSLLSYLRSWKYRTRWWLAGGIDPANCIAAYQPKGAADYAASKVNLANGAHTLTDGSPAPSWDTSYGWQFGSSSYLITDIVAPHTQAQSMFVRFRDQTATWAAIYVGSLVGNSNREGAYIAPYCFNSGLRGYSNLHPTTKAGGVTNGVMGFAGDKAFLNGTDEGITIGDAIYSWEVPAFLIGCAATWTWTDHGYNYAPNYFTNGKVQAISFYSSAITAAQASAVSAAMAAL